MKKAIDIHTHINHKSRFDSAPDSLLCDASLEYLIKMNEAAGIKKLFCSTFSSVISTEDIEAENEFLYNLAQTTDCLYQWVVIDPRIKNTFIQAEAMLKTPKCVGIKLHPPYHGYSLEEYGDEIFSFAQKLKAIVLIHPEESPDYILPFADKYPDVTFIMAHMGFFREESYADAIEFSKNRNVYADTSGSASTKNKVVEYVVERVGSDRILFGTDTYAAGFQKGRIEYALISDEDKENILFKNAEQLFGK